MKEFADDNFAADSLAAAGGGACDTLQLPGWQYGPDFAAAADSAAAHTRGFVTVSPEEMFGAQSSLGMAASYAEEAVLPEYGAIETNRATQLEVLAIFVAYTVMVLLYRKEVGSLLAGLFSSLHRQFVDRSYIFDIFINFATCLSFAAVGAGVVRIVAAAMPGGVGLPWGMVVVAAVVTVAAVTALQYAAVWMAGTLVLQAEAARELLFIKKIYASLVAVAVTPVVFMFFPVAGADVKIFLYVVGIETVVILAMFLVRTFKFFVSQKISIFYWILYLCTVEALPFSIIARIAHHAV